MGHTQTDIAKTLGRRRKTIYNELKRNSKYHSGKGYDSDKAQQLADQRKQEKPKDIRFTEQMKQEVKEKIENRWIPDLISHRARSEGRESVSHETIYLWQSIDQLLEDERINMPSSMNIYLPAGEDVKTGTEQRTNGVGSRIEPRSKNDRIRQITGVKSDT